MDGGVANWYAQEDINRTICTRNRTKHSNWATLKAPAKHCMGTATQYISHCTGSNNNWVFLAPIMRRPYPPLSIWLVCFLLIDLLKVATTIHSEPELPSNETSSHKLISDGCIGATESPARDTGEPRREQELWWGCQVSLQTNDVGREHNNTPDWYQQGV